jgi:hypothetical protein
MPGPRDTGGGRSEILAGGRHRRVDDHRWEAPMTVERKHAGHQTRYELHGDGGLSAVLTYTADPGDPATWKVLLPSPAGTEDLYGTERFPDPDAAQLQTWLTPIVGQDRATELTRAVDQAPPPTAAWRPAS